MNPDLAGQASSYELIPADSLSAGANHTGVDIKDVEGSLLLLLSTQNVSGTSPTLDIHIEDSPDNSTYTDVSGKSFTQVTDAAASFQSMKIDSRAVDRYIRAVSALGGTSPVFDAALVAVAIEKYAS